MRAVNTLPAAEVSDLNSARSLAVLSVPPHSRVLCAERGDAATARLLAERGCHVAAVELDEESATFVRPQPASVFAGDIESREMNPNFDSETFDAVLMLDVLGYLREPSAALAWARGVLRQGGRLITSFSNVAHGAVRLSLLSGVFPYADRGLLDRARARFFDGRSAEALLLDAGLRIDERLRVTRGLADTEIAASLPTCPPDLIEGIRRDREAMTYEFVFVASHGVHGSIPAPDASLAERLQDRVEELEAQASVIRADAMRTRAEVEAHTATVRALEEQTGQHRQRVVDLEAELRRRMEELHVRHHDLQQLHADIAEREAFIAQFRGRAAADRAALDARGAELRQARAEVAAGDAGIAEFRQHASNLEQTVSARDAEIADLRQHASNLGVVIADLRQHASNLEQVVSARDAVVADLGRQASNLGREVSARDARVASLGRVVAERDVLIADLTRDVNALRQSTSWRITRPLRWVAGRVKKARHAA